ncbi:hypothetical protein [Bathymodiolus japonicus methanotrophic gill symbiont]|uniref:hypothetical protein n=1 Tax=Bathymodiolus japonicus methanotrophic gill symbiont TaxID=113269 RepID=UPI001C8F1CA9|nr:hypothetical protein [Bathymodiolus japonicus methanotrophic gill symbiont]
MMAMGWKNLNIEFQQPYRYNILCPWIFALIRFGRVVKNGFTAEDLLAYFSDNGFIQCNQYAPICFRRRNQLPDSFPQPSPRQS